MVGYLLGLPCMAFAPTAERPLDMIDGGSTLDNLPEPARIVDRMLIWAMAPVAAEQVRGRLVTLALTRARTRTLTLTLTLHSSCTVSAL